MNPLGDGMLFCDIGQNMLSLREQLFSLSLVGNVILGEFRQKIFCNILTQRGFYA